MRDLTRCVRDLNFQPAAVRRYVEENFSVEAMVRKYVSLYQQAVQERSRELVA